MIILETKIIVKYIKYLFLGLLLLSCETFDPGTGDPEISLPDVTIFTNSTITLSWEGNEFAADYRYRLEPISYADTVKTYFEWSEWTIDTSVTLYYLDDGFYNFYIKSRFNIETEQVEAYTNFLTP